MNINDYFPAGDYIKAETLQGREVTLIIEGVERVEYRDGTTAPALSFQGTDKKLGLNKTNAMRIADMHGHDTEGWIGKQITLMPDKTEFQGRLTDCVRVKIQSFAQSEPFPSQQAQGARDVLDDEIPF